MSREITAGSARYSCPCAASSPFYHPLPAKVLLCGFCGQPVVASIRISRALQQELAAATWQGSTAFGQRAAEFITSTMSLSARAVSPTSAIGKAITRALGSGREWKFEHRNFGHMVGRPGLASSDVKSKAALRRGLARSRTQNGKLGLQFAPNDRDPRVLGRLVEAEFQTRAARRIDKKLLSLQKVRGRIQHPALRIEVSVSADGTFTRCRPTEVKSVQPGQPTEKFFGKLVETIHQTAQQAMLLGASEALVVFIERRFDGRGRWFAVLLEDGLVEFHNETVAKWMRQGFDRTPRIGNVERQGCES